MNTPIHDPRFKQNLRDILWHGLYGPFYKQYNNRLAVLVNRNTLAGGFSHKSFIYKGELYINDMTLVPRVKNRLLPQFIPLMEEYLHELKTINNKEQPYINSFFTQVLNSSESMVDYLKLLPECLHSDLQNAKATYSGVPGKLSEEKISQILNKNKVAIQLIKQRMVTNLLI